MTLTNKDIIQRGYFPKEFPPPFNTFDLANHLDIIISEWDQIKQNPGSTLVKEDDETENNFTSRKTTFKKNSKKTIVTLLLPSFLSRKENYQEDILVYLILFILYLL
ncbi:hypothetical protein EZS27_014680 [termite gut metagenome]|uniref:Uncharacterized protein n=1 Tax=termite gut metagenome TaxID=433724 RepID=A0A5J4RW57_9ZZZZ